MTISNQSRDVQGAGVTRSMPLKGAMPSGSDFHQARKVWSHIKHRILGSYLSLLLGKVGRPGVNVFVVDGFAGQGRYENGEEGSPLIVAQLAANPVQPSRRDLMRCINVEEKKETFDNLQEATRSFVEKGIVTNLHGTFEEKLPEILQLVGDYPTFFFVDPFGTESAELPTLQRLAARRGKTEVMVRYDDTRVKRLIAWAKNHWNSLEERHRKTAEAFISRVGDLTSDSAIDAFLNADPTAGEALIKGYIAEVKRQGIFRFGIYYPVRNPLTGGHRYYLAHFCNHEDGYCYMADHMARVERVLEGSSRDTGDLFGNQPAQLELLNIRADLVAQVEEGWVKKIFGELPRLIELHHLSGQRVENRKVFAAIVDHFGYSTTRKEWVKALRELEKARKLTMDGTDDGDFTQFQSL
jgi:three-Cys-motif partner protein